MKKLTVWALLAMLVIAGSAFAAPQGVVSNATFTSGNPTTTNNDDSCDIGVAPAATLLLPYFEVSPDGRQTTNFSITNTSDESQIVHITLWTDRSFPVIDFNVFLTGYDVQSINLHDVIFTGVIAPDLGTGTDISNYGILSADDFATGGSERFYDLNLGACDELPGAVPDVYKARMQQAFISGGTPAFGNSPACANNTVGNNHANGNAIGYATMDVALLCSTSLPNTPAYFNTEILFDNVLVGDYSQIDFNQNYAQGNAMVHIRAVPEGGLPTFQTDTNFIRTFYSRYQCNVAGTLCGTQDRRQPLPSTFAARWVAGNTADQFQTSFKIWREGVTTGQVGAQGNNACQYSSNITSVTETIVFDEEENPRGAAPSDVISPPIQTTYTLPETSNVSITDRNVFPAPANNAAAGWVYLNLDNNAADVINGFDAVSQNWVIVSMKAQGRFSVDFDAAWLGNGCSPEEGQSVLNNGLNIIGPAVALVPTAPVENYNP
jgi:hypothetical protein